MSSSAGHCGGALLGENNQQESRGNWKCEMKVYSRGRFHVNHFRRKKYKILTGNSKKSGKKIVNYTLATQRSQSRWYLARRSLSLSRSPLNLTDLQEQPLNKSSKWKHCCGSSTKTYGTEQRERVTALNRGNKLNGFPRSAERVSVLFSEKGTEFLSRSRRQRAVWKKRRQLRNVGRRGGDAGQAPPCRRKTNAKHLLQTH